MGEKRRMWISAGDPSDLRFLWTALPAASSIFDYDRPEEHTCAKGLRLLGAQQKKRIEKRET